MKTDMATHIKLPTAFAPAERAEREHLSDQARHLQTQVTSVMQFLLDTAGDILLVLNEQRQIVYANQTLHRSLDLEDDYSALGQRPGEVLGCTDVDQMTGGCGTSILCRTCGLALAIVSGLQGAEAVKECSIKQNDGTALEFCVRARPLELDGEHFVVISLKDISDEKRRYALERIFYHDILNSAGLVFGLVELLDEDNQEDFSSARDMLRMVCNRLIDEIQAQRDLSSAEMHELALHTTPVNSLRLLDTIKSAYDAIVALEDPPFRVMVDAEAVDFFTDETLLRRVIGNMVKNALEASQPGDAITLSCTAATEHIEFGVHNPGFIPKAIKPQIFRRSFSTKDSNRGLGTYSMKLLTEQYLQGVVGFSSSPESGTRFYVRLPLKIGE